MVNSAHPTHFDGSLDADAPWSAHVRGIRANASRRSHAELDDSTDLDRSGDRGKIDELAEHYRRLRSELDLYVVGGCCGTDHEHVAAIAVALSGEPR